MKEGEEEEKEEGRGNGGMKGGERESAWRRETESSQYPT